MQTIAQRFDGVVLGAFTGRFGDVSVAHYLLSTRLLDASYAFSAIVGSLRQVANGRGQVSSTRLRRFAPAVAWFGLWCLAAATVAVLASPNGWDARLELGLAAIGSALFICTVRITLRQLARSQIRPLVARHAMYLAVSTATAVIAVGSRRPWIMLWGVIICGLASARSFSNERQNKPSAPLINS